MIGIEKKHIPLLVCNTLVIIFFSVQFLFDQNYEFLLYVASVCVFAAMIIYSNQFIRYSMPVLVLLSL
jgi:hypothetical protein